MCLEIGYPTLASVPHSIINGYKRVLAVAVETDYSFPLAEKVSKTAQHGGNAGCFQPNLLCIFWNLILTLESNYFFFLFTSHRSKPTLLIHLHLLSQLLQQQQRLLQPQLLLRKRSRKSLRNQTMTWALGCLTK